MEHKKLTIFQGGIIFSVTEIVFLIFSFLDIFENYYVSGVVGEVAAIALPAFIFVLIFKKEIKENFKIRKVGVVNSLIIVVTMWFAMPVTIAASYISVILVDLVFHNNIMAEIPTPENIGELLLSMLVVGLFAAACEELLFRGALLSSVEKIGIKKSAVLVSILFALFHFNLEKALGVFLLSLIICYIVYRTNSIFAGMIAHFTNNATAVVIAFLAIKLVPEGLSDSEQAMSDMLNQTPTVMFMAIIILLVVAVVSGAIVFSLLYLLKSRTEKTKIIIDEKIKIKRSEFVMFLPGILVMVGMYVYLITRYIGG